MRFALIALVAAVGFLPQTPGSAQAPTGPKVQIKFEDGGLVTLAANGATIREILAEWSRQGGSLFVNAERLSGTPLTLEYASQPEKDVMASLLRQAAGYVLGPRRAGTVGASSFEVVYILPTSNPSASVYSAPQPTYQPQLPTMGNPDDELAPVGRGAPGPQPVPTPTPTPTPDPYGRPPGSPGVAVTVVPVTTPPIAGAPPPPPPTPPAGRSGAAGS